MNIKRVFVFFILFVSMAYGLNETNITLDYVTKDDIIELTELMNAVRDDSASTRRMIEVNTRRLEELESRSWATSGEVQNLSRYVNESRDDITNQVNEDISKVGNSMYSRFQTIKGEIFLLVLVMLGFTLVALNTVIGWKYREIIKHLGMFPRETPLTNREKELKQRLDKLEKQFKEQKEKPKMPLWKLALSTLILGVVIVGFFGGLMYLLLTFLGVF